MNLEQAIQRLRQRYKGGARILLEAALVAAAKLAEVRQRHDEAFAAHLLTGDEEPWDAYLVELGEAELSRNALDHWARTRIEGCDQHDPDPGCGCYECDTYNDPDDDFYAYVPVFLESQKLRAGMESHAKLISKAVGG